jgi:hypothetical protein
MKVIGLQEPVRSSFPLVPLDAAYGKLDTLLADFDVGSAAISRFIWTYTGEPEDPLGSQPRGPRGQGSLDGDSY